MHNRLHSIHILIFFIAAVQIQPLFAQGMEFQPEVAIQIQSDDNVFLLAEEESVFDHAGGDSRSDIILDGFFTLGGIYESDRHSTRIDAEVFRRNHNEYGVLDFTGGNFGIQWNWLLSPRWKTELAYDFIKNQSSFSEENLASGDIFNQNRIDGEAIYGLSPDRDIYIGSSFKSRDYEQRDVLENERFDIRLGFTQRTSRDNSFGFEISQGEGEYPNRLNLTNFVDRLQSYSEQMISGNMEWNPGERSRVNLEAGYINREHNSELSEFDYNGLVFNLRFRWSLGARTDLTVQAIRQIRDTENSITLFNKDTRLRTSIEWQSTSKLSFTLSASLFDTDFVQANREREDSAKIFEVGANYAFSERSSTELTLRARDRSSNNALNEFDNNLALISYRYKFY